MIKTVSELIDQLGGTNAVGDMCGGIGKTAVSHWRVNGRIPDRHKYRLFVECSTRGLTVAPDIFGEPAAVNEA